MAVPPRSINATVHTVSTPESRQYSAEAIRRILVGQEAYLANTEAGNRDMLLAAYTAGKAIRIAQTTAGHAMCYQLTSLYGVAHGHAAALVNRKLFPYTAEHLELCVDNPFDLLDSIRHAGSVFLGRNCPEALGDYFAGPNHTLPTQGTARFSSPLSVDDFIKKMQFTYFTPAALSDAADDVALFACAEGLTGHARSALIRGEDEA